MKSLQRLAMDTTSSFVGHRPDDVMELTKIYSISSRVRTCSSTLSWASSAHTHNLTPGSHSYPSQVSKRGGHQDWPLPPTSTPIPERASPQPKSSLLETTKPPTVGPQPKSTTRRQCPPASLNTGIPPHPRSPPLQGRHGCGNCQPGNWAAKCFNLIDHEGPTEQDLSK